MADVNMCLAVNGGTLADSAVEAHRDNDFSTSPDYVSGGGGSAAAYLYICVNGTWTYVAGYSGSGLPGWSWNTGAGGAQVNGPWLKVTGIRIVLAGPSAGTKSIMFPSATITYAKWGTAGDGNNDVARGYSMEMQAWGHVVPLSCQAIFL